ncbi:hypothetical protein ABRY77_10525 [Enterococcus casseliflavus]|uniref:hypothetical protein n=1 Tax=Enterococcus casseliflavus TaxID=37734 RepID=UPI003EDF17A0
MAKRYIVTEDNGCGCLSGCGGVIGFLLIGSFLMVIAPYLIGFFVVLAIILGIIFIPKIRLNKQKQREEAELDERERRLALEQRRRDLERREKEMSSSSERKDWSDF